MPCTCGDWNPTNTSGNDFQFLPSWTINHLWMIHDDHPNFFPMAIRISHGNITHTEYHYRMDPLGEVPVCIQCLALPLVEPRTAQPGSYMNLRIALLVVEYSNSNWILVVDTNHYFTSGDTNHNLGKLVVVAPNVNQWSHMSDMHENCHFCCSSPSMNWFINRHTTELFAIFCYYCYYYNTL